MPRFFINRPVFAIVIAIIIVILGALAGFTLPIAQYPQISPPSIEVKTMYVGANAGVVNETVAQVVEEQVNGTQGMDYMYSVSDDFGQYDLVVVFELGTDKDMDNVKVQNNVSIASASLPADVQTYGLTTKTASKDMAYMASLYSPDNTYSLEYLQNYANIYMVDKLKRVKGVGNLNLFGADYAMRIWLNPAKLAELGPSISDVIGAIREQNVQAPAGTIGMLPTAETQEKQFTGKVSGRLTTPEEFGNVIIHAEDNGSFVRLRDIARINTGPRNTSMASKTNGTTGIGMGVQLTNDANAMETITNVKAILAEASKEFPPGMAYREIQDNTRFISASMNEVAHTFFEALVLVMVIMYLFLQNWRSTLIPMLAVPVSLVGTFAAFILLDFTINTLTLFAMVLAIGLVVDDAIVVIENVERIMEEEHLPPKEATEKAMDEVQGPVVAIAFVLAAVFVPVAFMGGMMGVLYRQFALTIAVSMALSAFIALTLTPALCSMILKPHDPNAAKPDNVVSRFFDKFNDWFARTTQLYVDKVTWLLGNLKLGVVTLGAIVLAMLALYKFLPSTFVPDEDQGYFITSVALPPGTSMNKTQESLDKVAAEIAKMNGVDTVMAITGFDVLSSSAKSNTATIFAGLKDWGERKSADTQVGGIIGKTFAAGAQVASEATVIALNPPSLPGLGSVGGFNLQLQDMSGHTDGELDALAKRIVAAANQRPELVGVYTTFNIDAPVYEFEVDREKVKNLGVQLSDVFMALQVNFGGAEVNDFNRFGRTYKVVLQSDTTYRSEAEAAKFVFVRSRAGTLVPLDTLLRPKVTTGASSVSRFNGSRAIAIQGNAATGYSSGQALDAIEDVVRQYAGVGYNIEWSDQSREEKGSGSKTMQVLGMALVFVFLCLAALYESWSVPFAVLLTVPTGVFGALLFEFVTGQQNSIYMQIGIIMIMGLAAKNAILIVEFAKERRDNGMDAVQAAIESAGLRLRPILMTSLAFIIGCIPLAIATGAGAASRNNMGIAVVGGMIVATTLGIFLIPVFYVVVEHLAAKLRRHPVAKDLSLSDALKDAK